MNTFKNFRKDGLFSFSPSWINKYTICLLVFVVWLAFFDTHNLFVQNSLASSLEKLETEKKEYVAMIATAKKEREDMENDMEKFAREKYYMHKDDEDVFIIEKK